MSGPRTIFDKPNRYIGQPEVRRDAKRLLHGRGQYVDDLALPRMLHAAFVRSPYAHAKILSIDVDEARVLPGVVAIYSGADLAESVEPTWESSAIWLDCDLRLSTPWRWILPAGRASRW